MSDEARAMQERWDGLCAEFLRPLLAGGTVIVARPLSPAMLDHFAHARPSDLEVDHAIFRALHDAAGDLAPVRAIPWPDRGLAATIMAAHDLIAVTDPTLGRWIGRKSRDQLLAWVDWLLEEAGPARTRGAALARHAVVSRVLEAQRKDVVVRNWAYTYRFFGRPVPPRVTAMPKFRMVRQEVSDRALLELWDALEQELGTATRMRTLLDRSPVTALLRTDLGPDLRLGIAHLAVLSDDLLRYGVARTLSAQGDRVAAPIGRALRQLAAQGCPPRMLYYAIALVWEIHVITALDAHTGDAAPFTTSMDADARLFAAIMPAVLGAPDDLSALLDLDPDDLELLRHRAPDLDRAAGSDASRLAVSLIGLAAPPRLDHERDDDSISWEAGVA